MMPIPKIKNQKSKRKENTFISLAVDPERRNSSLLPSPSLPSPLSSPLSSYLSLPNGLTPALNRHLLAAVRPRVRTRLVTINPRLHKNPILLSREGKPELLRVRGTEARGAVAGATGAEIVSTGGGDAAGCYCAFVEELVSELVMGAREGVEWKGKGRTGLGLQVCGQVEEHFRWQVESQSELLLPLAEPSSHSSPGSMYPSPHLGGELSHGVQSFVHYLRLVSEIKGRGGRGLRSSLVGRSNNLRRKARAIALYRHRKMEELGFRIGLSIYNRWCSKSYLSLNDLKVSIT